MLNASRRLLSDLKSRGLLTRFVLSSAVRSVFIDRRLRRPIFIMGTNGCGHTWIAGMLSHSPRHIFIHEIKLFGGTSGLVRWAVRFRQLIPGRLLFVFFELFYRARLWTLNRHAEKFQKAGDQRGELLSAANLKTFDLSAPYTNHWDFDFIVKPSPIAMVALLKRAYPGAIQCFVVRDPRDACVTMRFHKPGSARYPVAESARICLRTYAEFFRYRDECAIDLLRYEQVCQATKAELRGFFTRHGLAIDEGRLNEAVYQHDATNMRTSRTPAVGNLIKGPKENWRVDLSPSELTEVEVVLAQTIVDFGYEKSPC